MAGAVFKFQRTLFEDAELKRFFAALRDKGLIHSAAYFGEVEVVLIEPPAKTGKKPQPELDLVNSGIVQEFDTWYALYPHKVGREAAKRAFLRARRQISFDGLISGVRRYCQEKPDDRNWCNPATWLNEGRWSDERAVDETRSSAAQRQESRERVAVDQHERARAELAAGAGVAGNVVGLGTRPRPARRDPGVVDLVQGSDGAFDARATG